MNPVRVHHNHHAVSGIHIRGDESAGSRNGIAEARKLVWGGYNAVVIGAVSEIGVFIFELTVVVVSHGEWLTFREPWTIARTLRTLCELSGVCFQSRTWLTSVPEMNLYSELP